MIFLLKLVVVAKRDECPPNAADSSALCGSGGLVPSGRWLLLFSSPVGPAGWRLSSDSYPPCQDGA